MWEWVRQFVWAPPTHAPLPVSEKNTRAMLLSADCRVKKGDAPSPKATRACAWHSCALLLRLAQLMRAVNSAIYSFAARESRHGPRTAPAAVASCLSTTTAGRLSRSRWVACPGGAHHPHPAGRAPATARRRRARSASSPDHAVQRRAGHTRGPRPQEPPSRALLAFRFVRSFFHFPSPTRSFCLVASS